MYGKNRINSQVSKNLMRGFTLIEVVMSILIAAMAVMATFSVVLSSFVSADKADRNQEAAAIMRYASEKLKAYVSADWALGGDYALPGGGKWGDDTSGKWALHGTPAGFTHNITDLLNRLDTDFTFGKPGDPGRSLKYTVTDTPCGTFTDCKKVVFTLSYPD